MFKAILILCSGILLLSCQTKSQKVVENQTDQVMKNNNYTSTILVNQNPETSFESIKNFRGWWSEEIEGSTGTLGETFFYHYQDVHLCKVKLIEEIPNQKLVYLVTDNEFSFVEDKTEWINTHLVFELTEKGNQTQIKFTHEGLTPEDECYQVCEDAWGNYIQNSLKDLIETGKGSPNGKEGGLNAELVEKWGLSQK